MPHCLDSTMGTWKDWATVIITVRLHSTHVMDIPLMVRSRQYPRVHWRDKCIQICHYVMKTTYIMHLIENTHGSSIVIFLYCGSCRFYHIPQGYSGTGAMIWLPQYPCSNPERYGKMSCVDPPRIVIINKIKHTKANPWVCRMVYICASLISTRLLESQASCEFRIKLQWLFGWIEKFYPQNVSHSV